MRYITDILSSHRNIDIFSTTETHITDETGELHNVEGYYFVHKNRKQGKGGGVAFYINERLDWQRRTDLESEDLECI